MEQYPQVDLSNWKQVGEGGNGIVYLSDDEPGVLLKINTVNTDEKDTQNDFYTSKAVFELGVPTPEMYQMVMSGENYGYKCQAIEGKKSIARLCADDTSTIDANATMMAQLLKEFHAKTVKDNEWIPSMKERMLEAAQTTDLVGGKAKARLIEFVKSIPESDHLLHGDLQMGNMIVADEKPYWIDLGRASHGIPLFDLGHFYLFCNIFGRSPRVQKIAHMTDKELMQFWNTFAQVYNGPENMDSFTKDCRKYAALDIIVLGMIQHLSFSERFFLGTLAKKMLK
ncbi:MAG: phosphotransferase [Bacteroidales bacterium]|nr:phosphotransferase [Bacteroidales bacterium]